MLFPKTSNKFLKIYPNFKLKKQRGSTYNRKRTFLDSKIDLNRTIKSQFKQLVSSVKNGQVFLFIIIKFLKSNLKNFYK